MHELSVAREILAVVRGEMSRQHLTKIETVKVRLGALTGLNADALAFGFEASVANTSLDGAVLDIEIIPIRGKCKECERSFDINEMIFLCPQCGSGEVEVTAGEELEIVHLVGS
jgi:hydrogenase nickel incorporation protein HypA/HybF